MVVSLFCTKVSGRHGHLVQVISFILWTVFQLINQIVLYISIEEGSTMCPVNGSVYAEVLRRVVQCVQVDRVSYVQK